MNFMSKTKIRVLYVEVHWQCYQSRTYFYGSLLTMHLSMVGHIKQLTVYIILLHRQAVNAAIPLCLLFNNFIIN